MKGQAIAWDAEYRAHGRMWRGPGDIGDIVRYLPEGGRVLELGCGNGKTLETLEASGFHIVGVDFSAIALGNMDTRCPVLLADIRRLPLNGSFNGVIAYHVLENIRPGDVQGVLDDIWSLLLPGGYLFMKIFTKEDMRAARTTRGAGIMYHYYDEDDVRRLLAGYDIVELTGERKEKRYRAKTCVRSWIRAIARKV